MQKILRQRALSQALNTFSHPELRPFLSCITEILLLNAPESILPFPAWGLLLVPVTRLGLRHALDDWRQQQTPLSCRRTRPVMPVPEIEPGGGALGLILASPVNNYGRRGLLPLTKACDR